MSGDAKAKAWKFTTNVDSDDSTASHEISPLENENAEEKNNQNQITDRESFTQILRLH